MTACAIPYSALGHGFVERNRGVVGFSGVIYATLAYQVALLAKNWKEMRCRSHHPSPLIAARACISSAQVRLLVIVFLILSEIALMQRATNVSHGGHGIGAASGMLTGLAIGSNVYLDCWEVVAPVLGVIGHLALSLAGFVTMQVAGATYGLILSVPLAVYASKELKRWGA